MDRQGLSSQPGFVQFASRAYRMQQEIKAKRIEKLEKENEVLRKENSRLLSKETDLQGQLHHI